MSATPRIKLCMLAVTLSALPWVSHAVSMGQLDVQSELGQPLNGQIELMAVQPNEAESMKVTLASPETYLAAKLVYPSASLGLRLALDKQSNGKQVIQISSTKAIDEPILELLVELRWSTGELRRNYSVLLDPTDHISDRRPGEEGVLEAKANAIAPPVSLTALPVSESVSEGIFNKVNQPRSSKGKVNKRFTSDRKYKVRPGDTLISIARQNQIPGLSLGQMMVGLFHANPNAFSGNINRLGSGKILNMPGKKQLKWPGKIEATKEIRVQNKHWQTHRRHLGEAVAKSSVAHSKAVHSASGKIVTKVEDTSASSVSKSKDVLKLSTAEQRQGHATTSNEESSARQKSLAEHNQRIVELEKNIKKMEALAALETKTRGPLQNKASSTASDQAPPIAAPTTLAASQVVVSAASQASSNSAVPSKTGPSQTRPVEPISPSSDHASFLDMLVHNAWSVGVVGLATLALLMGLFVLSRRRNRLHYDGDSHHHDLASDSDHDPMSLARTYMDTGNVKKAHEILSKMVQNKGSPKS